MGKARRINAAQRDTFADICEDTRRGFTCIIDLLLIHNEKRVSGLQPRATLNQLIAMQSVSTWERLVSDVGGLARREQRDGRPALPGVVDSRGFSRLSNDTNGGSSTAVSTLSAASGRMIPDCWQIRIPTNGRGKELSFGRTTTGLDPQLAELVDWWVDVRNGVAHRSMPQLAKWIWVTDAYAKDGHTINTTSARAAFTLFLQLSDQAIRALVEAAEFSNPNQLLLPEDWLAGNIQPQRGVTDPEQLRLWRGRSLAIHSSY